jgi:hypothetical protein
MGRSAPMSIDSVGLRNRMPWDTSSSWTGHNSVTLRRDPNEKPHPGSSIKGDVKRKSSPIELDPGEISLGIQSQRLRFASSLRLEPCLPSSGWSPISAFPRMRKWCSERLGAVKGTPVGAALRTLDGEDRSGRRLRRLRRAALLDPSVVADAVLNRRARHVAAPIDAEPVPPQR